MIHQISILKQQISLQIPLARTLLNDLVSLINPRSYHFNVCFSWAITEREKDQSTPISISYTWKSKREREGRGDQLIRTCSVRGDKSGKQRASTRKQFCPLRPTLHQKIENGRERERGHEARKTVPFPLALKSLEFQTLKRKANPKRPKTLRSLT